MPKVSVLMPCYNHEKYVATAIESVLNQTYKDFELIVVDNGCTDKSYDVIQRYEDRIRIIRLKKNDLVLCGKVMLEAAKGEYIAYMTSDDFWMPDKLEKQIDILEKYPDVAACTTWAYTADEQLDYDKTQKNIFMFHNCGRAGLLRHFLEEGNCIAFPSSVIRRETMLQKEKPQRGYRQLDDLFLWIHLLLEKEIYIVEEPLMVFRWHTSGTNQNMSAPTQENLIRHWNEMADIIGYTLDKMSDDLFLQTFEERIRNKEINSPMEVLCEKFHWLKDKAVEQPLLENQLLDFFYRHCSEEFLQVMTEQYGFSLNDFWTISGTKGFPANYSKLEVEKSKNSLAYRIGAKDVIERLCKVGSEEYKKQMLLLLSEDNAHYISLLSQLMGKILLTVTEHDIINKTDVYLSILSALNQMIIYIDYLRSDLLFLGIDIKEEEWQMYKSLIEFGKNQRIDLFECVIPYTEWIYKEIVKALPE